MMEGTCKNAAPLDFPLVEVLDVEPDDPELPDPVADEPDPDVFVLIPPAEEEEDGKISLMLFAIVAVVEQLDVAGKEYAA